MSPIYRQTRPSFVLALFLLVLPCSSLSLVAAHTTTYDNESPQLSYSPSESWEVSASSGDVHWYDGGGTWTTSPGAKLRLVFAGKQLSIFGRSTGSFDVLVDGKPLRSADVYNLSTSSSGTVSERLSLATNLSRSDVHEAVLEMKGEGILFVDRVAVATATDCLPLLFDDDSVGRACTTNSSTPAHAEASYLGTAGTTVESSSSSGSEVKSTVVSSRTTISSYLIPSTSSSFPSPSSSFTPPAPSASSAPSLTTSRASSSSLRTSTSSASYSSTTAYSLSTFSTLNPSSSSSAKSSSVADNSTGDGAAASASDKVAAKEAGGIAVAGLAALGLALFAFCLCQRRRGGRQEDDRDTEEKATALRRFPASGGRLDNNPQRSSIFGLLLDVSSSNSRNPFADPAPSQPTFAARPLSLSSDSSIVLSYRPRQIPASSPYASAATLPAASNRKLDDVGGERQRDMSVAAIAQSRPPPSTPQGMEDRWRTQGPSLARGLTDMELLQIMRTDGVTGAGGAGEDRRSVEFFGRAAAPFLRRQPSFPYSRHTLASETVRPSLSRRGPLRGRRPPSSPSFCRSERRSRLLQQPLRQHSIPHSSLLRLHLTFHRRRRRHRHRHRHRRPRRPLFPHCYPHPGSTFGRQGGEGRTVLTDEVPGARTRRLSSRSERGSAAEREADEAHHRQLRPPCTRS